MVSLAWAKCSINVSCYLVVIITDVSLSIGGTFPDTLFLESWSVFTWWASFSSCLIWVMYKACCFFPARRFPA